MSKAFLVIDMPQTCGECPLCASYQENAWSFREYWCPVLKNADVDPFAKKPRDCPLLKPPEHVLIRYEEEDDWARGYNACLDEILGEPED